MPVTELAQIDYVRSLLRVNPSLLAAVVTSLGEEAGRRLTNVNNMVLY
jgi:hypothetical protein